MHADSGFNLIITAEETILFNNSLEDGEDLVINGLIVNSGEMKIHLSVDKS